MLHIDRDSAKLVHAVGANHHVIVGNLQIRRFVNRMTLQFLGFVNRNDKRLGEYVAQGNSLPKLVY